MVQDSRRPKNEALQLLCAYTWRIRILVGNTSYDPETIVFAAGWNMFTYIGNQFVGHAVAFQGLKNSGVEISPLAQGFIDTYGTEALTMPNMIGAAFLIAGLLIAVLPMWVKTTD